MSADALYTTPSRPIRTHPSACTGSAGHAVSQTRPSELKHRARQCPSDWQSTLAQSPQRHVRARHPPTSASRAARTNTPSTAAWCASSTRRCSTWARIEQAVVAVRASSLRHRTTCRARPGAPDAAGGDGRDVVAGQWRAGRAANLPVSSQARIRRQNAHANRLPISTCTRRARPCMHPPPPPPTVAGRPAIKVHQQDSHATPNNPTAELKPSARRTQPFRPHVSSHRWARDRRKKKHKKERYINIPHRPTAQRDIA